MGSAWLERSEVEGILHLEAAGVASHLGHRMGKWEALREEGVSIARCTECSDVATVAVRRFRKAPISGAAVELRCAGRRGGEGGAPGRSSGPTTR